MILTRLATLSLAALLLGACAATGGDGSAVSARPTIMRFPHSTTNADCFLQRSIDNFEVLNNSNLLVFEGRRRVYHVELAPSAVDLRHAYGIEFTSSTGRVCGRAGERLYVSGSFSGFPPAVTGVYRLDDSLQAAVRAHFGQAPDTAAFPEEDDANAAGELVTDLEPASENGGEAPPSQPADSSPGD